MVVPIKPVVLRRAENPVEVLDTPQSVHIDGIPVEKLALNHAGNVHKFGDKPPQHAPIVHYLERGKHPAPELQNRKKALVVFGVGAVVVVD